MNPTSHQSPTSPHSALTAAVPMPTHELLELASLDAMGLLDVDEREQFERAFRSASPSVQAMLRREQLRWTGMDDGSPAIEPPPGLKARVLAAVREAIQTVDPRRLTLAGVEAAPRSLTPRLQSAQGVNRLWRAAAIGSIAAAVVLAFTYFDAVEQHGVLQGTISSNVMSDHLHREFGARFDQMFFGPDTRMLSFAATSAPAGAGGIAASSSKATMLFNPTARKAQIFVKDLLPVGADYELVVLDSSKATVKTLLRFRATSTGNAQHTIEGLDLEVGQMLAIRRVGETEAMLISRTA
jgi:hypothetical protein